LLFVAEAVETDETDRAVKADEVSCGIPDLPLPFTNNSIRA
jgi:hypothetical protein